MSNRISHIAAKKNIISQNYKCRNRINDIKQREMPIPDCIVNKLVMIFNPSKYISPIEERNHILVDLDI